MNTSTVLTRTQHFGDKPTVYVATPDESIYENHYLVSLDYFSVYLVISCDEQSAIDELIDTMDAGGDHAGLFMDEEEADENTFRAGNYGKPISCDHVLIEKL
tara:strand:- start:2027 stop:2332 length:306 start_codon:yes stop_codon:yes gene_type:complete